MTETGRDDEAATGQRDLTRHDWVMAALAAMAEGGVEAVKVERLARTLGVSKGSFYWHFKDRPALLSAVLDLWDGEFTRQLIDHAAHLPTPAERLREVARQALVATMHGVDSARAEAAVQAWATTDATAAARLAGVEAVRIGYIARELTAAGMAEDKAKQMGKALYMALLGLYAARGHNAALADDAAFLALSELVLADAGA